MRLPVIPPIDSRDGVSDKDGQCKNLLFDVDGEQMFACIRPALNSLSSSSGAGGGIAEFSGDLISVFGSTLYSDGTSIGTLTAGFFDFAESTA